MTYIGTDENQKPVYIDLTKHTLVVGSSGMGKSTLLSNLYIDRVRQNHGVALVDPHGDLADNATRYHPKSRMWDFIYLDPSAKRVIGLNPFYLDNPDEVELSAESLFTLIKSLAGSAWGDESARVIVNAIDSVIERFDHPSPLHVFRFIADDAFREHLLAKTRNPFLKMFKAQYDEKLRDSEQMSKFSPPINKVGKLMRPAILPIVCQTTSIDFLNIMNQQLVFVARLSKGRLGEEISQIIGSIIINLISIVAMRREKQEIRPDFTLIVDELPNFAHGGRFASLLAESRKYGIGIVGALQGLYQVPFKESLLGAENQIVYNSGGEDAELIAKNWGMPNLAAEITDLPKFTFMLRRFVPITDLEGRIISYSPIVTRVKAAPPADHQPDDVKSTTLIKHSLQAWGADKKAVTKNLMRFLRN